jgi:selenocysteine-specific elongation factor
VRPQALAASGVTTADRAAVHVVDGWLVDPGRWTEWQQQLRALVDEQADASPLDPRVSAAAARRRLGLPDQALLVPLAAAAGLAYADGRVARPESSAVSLGAAEEGLAQLEQHLRAHPFAAPERPDLDRWGLGVPELAAAERTGRVVRLTADVVLLPAGPALAMRTLSGLPQPFTTSQAREALQTTRRVAIPLLEHLDRRGWTRRLDSGHRQVREH